jgi:hypothetical protein
MMKTLCVILFSALLLVSCGSEKQDAPKPDVPKPTHLGGCVLLTPAVEAPEDVYQDSGILATDEYKPFTKKLVVYGITLIGRDDISDVFMRKVAKTIKEMFPQGGAMDAELQKEVLRNMYRYKAVIPLFKGEDHTFNPEDEKAFDLTRSRNSICDIIMEGVPGQVNEVVEHILHYVTDLGLHYTFPGEWGISETSKVYKAMQEAIDKKYYNIAQYGEDPEEEKTRVLIQEYAYWLIYCSWDLRETYGPKEAEFSIMNSAGLKANLPRSYQLFEQTITKIMAPPSPSTLKEFLEPTKGEVDPREAEMKKELAKIKYDVPREPDVNYEVLDNIDISNSEYGVAPLPESLGKTLNGLFSKYTKLTAPNGKPIHIFAQSRVSDLQVVRAREILKYHLSDAPGTLYGKDKTAIANRMADVKAMLFYTDTQLKAFAMYDILDKTKLATQDLYATESPVEGSYEYINNKGKSGQRFTRDASYEEIMHLVHGKGLEYVLPEYHKEIVAAELLAIKEKRYFYGRPAPHEYIITGFDVYFGLWAHNPQGDGRAFGHEYPFHTKEEMKAGDPLLYDLVEKFWPKYLTYNAYIDPSFEGTFSTVLDKTSDYTYKSQHLVNIILTGTNNSNILGNDRDNRLTGNKGDNILDGGPGNDTAFFSGMESEYTISREGENLVVLDTVKNRDGKDTLRNIEFIRFKDKKIETSDNSGK